ncbi:hypothetical protein LXL04_004147 [Taraxacum kok-saghyz]
MANSISSLIVLIDDSPSTVRDLKPVGPMLNSVQGFITGYNKQDPATEGYFRYKTAVRGSGSDSLLLARFSLDQTQQISRNEGDQIGQGFDKWHKIILHSYHIFASAIGTDNVYLDPEENFHTVDKLQAFVPVFKELTGKIFDGIFRCYAVIIAGVLCLGFLKRARQNKEVSSQQAIKDLHGLERRRAELEALLAPRLHPKIKPL